MPVVEGTSTGLPEVTTPAASTTDDGPRPACVLFDPASAGFRVAALPVLDRLLVGLHRAGCGPISVVAGAPLPPLPRTAALRVPFVVVEHPVASARPMLVLRSDALVETGDLRRLMSEPAPVRLVTASGEPLPIGVVGPGDGDPLAALAGAHARTAGGVAGLVRNPDEAGRMTDALWASITSGSDGLVDRVFNRPMGRPLSRLLVHTPVTPNAVSVASILIGVFAAALFADGRPGWSVAAAVIFQVSAIIDCVDGDVARSVFKESPLGKWLDLAGDQVVHLSVFAGIAAGLRAAGGGPELAWLGLSAILGAGVSFLVVLRGFRLARRFGDESGRMQRILDAVTNRDFSVLVLALAVAQRLEWFLWLAGVGSHAFWVGLLILQRRRRPPPGEYG